jgi:hypothetical protein
MKTDDSTIITVRVSKQLKDKMELFLLENDVKNRSALLKRALVNLIEPYYEDKALLKDSLINVQKSLTDIKDQMRILFNYTLSMHENILAYNTEIPEDLKYAAVVSAKSRFERFFKNFAEKQHRDSPEFFERILHEYYTNEKDNE